MLAADGPGAAFTGTRKSHDRERHTVSAAYNGYAKIMFSIALKKK